MEPEISGKVDCREVSDSRAVHSFVEKRIRRWLSSKAFEGVGPKVRFHVIFERQGEGHAIGCHVTLHSGQELWMGSFYANGLHRALTSCLNHMSQPKSQALAMRMGLGMRQLAG